MGEKGVWGEVYGDGQRSLGVGLFDGGGYGFRNGFVVGGDQDCRCRRTPTRSFPLVNLLAVELPASGVAVREPRKPYEFRRLRLRIALSRQLFQIVAYQLIDAGSENVSPVACALDHLVVDGESDVHLYT